MVCKFQKTFEYNNFQFHSLLVQRTQYPCGSKCPLETAQIEPSAFRGAVRQPTERVKCQPSGAETSQPRHCTLSGLDFLHILGKRGLHDIEIISADFTVELRCD